MWGLGLKKMGANRENASNVIKMIFRDQQTLTSDINIRGYTDIKKANVFTMVLYNRKMYNYCDTQQRFYKKITTMYMFER